MKKFISMTLCLICAIFAIACADNGNATEQRYMVVCESEYGAVILDNERPLRWESVTASITPQEGYRVTRVTVNGRDYTKKLINGKITVENITEDIVIKVLYSAAVTVANAVDFTVTVPVDRETRILQLTDTQLIDSAQMRSPDRLVASQASRWTLARAEEEYRAYVRKTIELAEPDLILVTGDLIYGEFDDNGSLMAEFVKFMDGFAIPWCPVFGNHENESAMGVDWQSKQLEEAEYCLFKQRELTGNGNYTVGIKQGDKLLRTFFMMDSNGCAHMSEQSLSNGHSKTASGFGDDQIEWMRETANAVNSLGSKISLAFHIQIAETTKALAKYGYVAGGTKDNPVNIDKIGNDDNDFGYLGADIKTPWDGNGVVWNKIKSCGFDSLFFGHEHCNSASVSYNGVRFTYGLKSSTYDRANYRKPNGEIKGSYSVEGTPLVGGTYIGMDSSGNLTNLHHIYATDNTK